MSDEKLDMKSLDLLKDNIEFISGRFPNCVTETASGKVIDFDQLKQELSADAIEGNKERYRLEWPGKKEAIVTANLPINKTLRPIKEDSVDFDNTENIYIEGDNLEVLKLLQESYLGKVKMIYIDPPYNTGNDFVYKDSFTKSKSDELFESGQKDELGQRLVPNPETSGRYHSDWLSMMYPRLKLARNLLTDDGAIFISIDENEVHNLRKICDEVYGENNFISQAGWQKVYSPKNQARYLSNDYEFVLIYSKSISKFEIGLLPRTEEMDKRYKNPDNDLRGPWKAGDLVASGERKGGHYIIKNPHNGKEYDVPQGKHWAFSEPSMREMLKDNRIVFGSNNSSFPAFKQFLSEVKQGRVASSFFSYSDYGHTDLAKKEFINLFGDQGRTIFETIKPTKLIQNLFRIANADKDAIILDFFSGSATTAHALMQLNAEDQGNRKYILVQLPETTDEASEAYKAGYKNICEIGKERIRRAAKKIKEETNAHIDYGFRVYRLDESNMQDVYYHPQDYDQSKMDMFADNVKPDRTADDLLTQIMLDWGLLLNLKIENIQITGKQVYKVNGDSLYACFDKGLDESFAKEIAKGKPLRIVFRDNSFKDNSAKTNVKQLLKQLSPETEMKVI
jgi:adenine-specific DNA-methyltransferase